MAERAGLQEGRRVADGAQRRGETETVDEAEEARREELTDV